jgi:hypothetical protein
MPANFRYAAYAPISFLKSSLNWLSMLLMPKIFLGKGFYASSIFGDGWFLSGY